MSEDFSNKGLELPEQESYYEWIDETSYINPKDKPTPPPVALSFGEYQIDGKIYPTPIGTYGNFTYIQAKPKEGKTYLASLIAACYLSGTISNAGAMKGHRNNKKLLYFDTEQGYFHAHNVATRIVKMAGGANGSFLNYALRNISAENRLGFIDWKIRNTDDVGMVMIDGVADLLKSDVNDQEESNRIVQFLMSWTQEFNIHLMTIIHTNPGHEVKKATGHLGSQLERKTETTIHLQREDEHTVVKCLNSRNESFDTFAFKLKGSTPYIDKDYSNLLTF